MNSCIYARMYVYLCIYVCRHACIYVYTLTKLSHKFGKFRLHGERKSVRVNASTCEQEVGQVTFHILLQQASADCHCMLAGESMISSNMTISAFYRTQKLQFNVPRTYLCLIIRNKIGLPLANIGLFKWNHLAVTSFSFFNNRVRGRP